MTIIRDATTTNRNPVIGSNNLVTAANISATNVDGGYPASNLAIAATHHKWRTSAVVTSDYLTVDVTGSENVGYLAVADHNFFEAQFSCTIEIELANSPAVWHPMIAATLITSSGALIFQWVETSCTGVRLRIQGDGTQNAYAGVLYAGAAITLERSVRMDQNHTPITLGTVSDIVSGMSESGNFVGRMVKKQYNESVLSFRYFSNDFYRDTVNHFIEQAVDAPFFIAWAPEDYPDDTGYCWLTKDPKPEFHLPTETFIVSFEMRGIER